MTADYMAFFERRADVCGGELVVKGTRVTVRTILASLAEGGTIAELLREFPTLKEDAVRAVIAFAAASAEAVMCGRSAFSSSSAFVVQSA